MFSHRSLLCTVLGREPHSILTWSGDFFFSWQFNRLCLSLNAYGGAGARTAHFPISEGDRAVLEAYDTAVGDRDSEDRRGEGGEGGVAVVGGLTRDVPGDGPDLGGDILQQSGLAHIVFADGAGDGGEGVHGDKDVGAGGHPGCAVLGEATARDHRVAMGVILQLPPPGVQDTGAP